MRRAQTVATVVTVQNRYNVADRTSEGVLRACEAQDVAFLPWAPVARGDAISPAVARVARRHGLTAAQVMLAWLLEHSTRTVPIPGTGSVEHLEQNVAAAGVRLEPGELELLERNARAA